MLVRVCLHAVDALDGTHGGLEIQPLDVEPVLGEKRGEEVHAHVDVDEDLISGHADVTNGHTLRGGVDREQMKKPNERTKE